MTYQPQPPAESPSERAKRLILLAAKTLLAVVVVAYFCLFLWLLQALVPEDTDFTRFQRRISEQGISQFNKEVWK